MMHGTNERGTTSYNKLSMELKRRGQFLYITRHVAMATYVSHFLHYYVADDNDIKVLFILHVFQVVPKLNIIMGCNGIDSLG